MMPAIPKRILGYHLPLLALALCALSEASLLADVPTIVGDIRVAEAARDVMSTSRSHLQKGSIDCELIRWTKQGNLKIVGRYSWDEAREHFRGFYHRTSLATQTGEASGSGLIDEGAREVEWFRTPTEEARHSITDRFATKASPPKARHPEQYVIELNEIWFRHNVRSSKHVEDWFVPGELSRKFSIISDETNLTRIEKDAGDAGRATLVISHDQGGHLVELSNMPSSGDWEVARYQWKRHGSGTWYPESYVSERFPNGQQSDPDVRKTLIVKSFDPEPDFAEKTMSFSRFDLPLGTRVSVSLPSGHQLYTVGGGSGDQANFDRKLRRSAERLKSAGFAVPEGNTAP
jgi:hypothetical protein